MTDSEASTRLQSMLAVQRSAFDAAPMPGAASRVAVLKRLKAAILTRRQALTAAVCRDFGGRSLDEVAMAEVFPLVGELNHCIGRVARWMKPRRQRVTLPFQPARASVMPQPLGVVGVIAPWNYPLLLSLGPLIDILAAGNRAMIKMSEFTPATTHALRTVIETAFGPDEVALVDDDGSLAEAFARLNFDHLVFTGSSRVGREVLRAAAENWVPVTLELGGKSPVILGEDVDLAAAAQTLCWGKSFKSGQTCVAPDYVLCPRNRIEDFVAAFRRSHERMFPNLGHNPDVTPIFNERQYRRLTAFAADAAAKGARLETLNPAREDLSAIRVLPMVLIIGVTEAMSVMSEEIFGPLLPILAYDRIEEAIDCVARHPRPLVIYVFGDEGALRRRVLAGTHSGAVVFNDVLTHAAVPGLPFGGVGASGMGRYHGRAGFDSFSNGRTVFAKGRPNLGQWLYPPYGGFAQRIVQWLFVR